MAVMVATAVVLIVAHTIEALVWALAYALVGAAPAGSGLLYFAFVNYTTLGYGDVTPVQAWQLIGPMTAMNGILMFGWSTAVLFEVLRKTLEQFPQAALPGSILQVEASELLPVQQHDLALGVADEAEVPSRAAATARGTPFPASGRDSRQYRAGTSAAP